MTAHPTVAHGVDPVATLAATKRALTEGRYRDGYEVAMEAAAQYVDQHDYINLRRILEVLQRLLPSGELDEAQRAWVLNFSGLLQSQAGDSAGAEQLFKEMRSLGQQLHDPMITGTALMNEAAILQARGRNSAAENFFEQAFVLLQEVNGYSAAKILLNVARINIDTGRYVRASALLEAVDEYAHSISDAHLTTTAALHRGLSYRNQGDLEQAEKHFRRAARLALAAGEPGAQAYATQSIGYVLLEQNRTRSADRWLARAVEEFDKIGALEDLAATAVYWSRSLRNRNQPDRALSVLSRARRRLRREEALDSWATVTAALVLALVESERIPRAMALLRELQESAGRIRTTRATADVLTAEIVIARERRDIDGLLQAAARARHLSEAGFETTADILLECANAALLLDPTVAASLFNDAVSARQQSGETMAAAWEAAQAAVGLHGVGAPQLSLQFFAKSLTLYRRLKNKQMVFHVMNDRALAYEALGKHRRALQELRHALKAAEQLEDRVMIQQAEGNLAELLRRRNDLAAASDYAARAIATARSLGDEETAARGQAEAALIAANSGDLANAVRLYRRVQDAGRRLGSRDLVAQAVSGLADVAFRRQRWAEARRLFAEAVRLGDPATRQVHYVEDLGGVVLATAHMKRRRELQARVQALVDAAQAQRQEKVASQFITSAAYLYLQSGFEDEAGSLYAVGIVLGVTAAVRTGGQSLDGLTTPLASMRAALAARDLQEVLRFSERVLKALNELSKGSGTALRPYVRGVLEAAEPGFRSALTRQTG